MVAYNFYLKGKDPSVNGNVHSVDVDVTEDLEHLRVHVADSFSILDPQGVGFETKDALALLNIDSVLDCEDPVAITIDGNPVQKVPHPMGLPVVGNYYQVFPDHIGNNHRLFEQLGPVMQHTELGKTAYYTNNPAVALLVMQESPFWSKVITENHPLYAPKNNDIGLFLSDSHTRSWKLAHKYLAQALTPKAVRKYTPMVQEHGEESFKVFDSFCDNNEAFDAYIYMFKLTSQAIIKTVLNIDVHHFKSPDTELDGLVQDIMEWLELTKEAQQRPGWYSHMPFGHPKLLRDTQARFIGTVVEAVKKEQAKNGSPLPIATAAIETDSMAEFAARAIDEDGQRVPEDIIKGSMPIIIAAGFATTASLLSWMVHCAAMYPQVQDKLIQELIDHDVTADTKWNYDSVYELDYLTNFIQEVQRLYNPAHQPARTAQRDQIIPGGFEIPKGATMTTSLHSIHRNPKIWHNALAFDPDRWDTDGVRKRPAGSFMPFALGPRSCVGFNFALLEARVVFALFIYRYEFLKFGEEKVQYDTDNLVYRPEEVYVQIRRRTSWPDKSPCAEPAE